MSERDELRYVIHAEHCLEVVHGEDCLYWQDDLISAEAIIAAGYRKPRVVESAEELDALDEGSVVLSGGKIPRIKAEDGIWLGDGIDVDSAHIIRYTTFATVLHEGAAK